MGVMYDYFVAPSDDAAAAMIDVRGGPSGPLPPLPMPLRDMVAQYGHDGMRRFFEPKVRVSDSGVASLSTKGFDPVTDLATVHALLTGATPHEVLDRLQDPVIAVRDGGELLVLAIGSEIRDALAGATLDQLQRVAHEWVDAEVQYRRVDLKGASSLLEQLAELARIACARGDGLYCWVCV